MSTPLLTTKLYIPPPRPALVPRPRLVEQLNTGLNCKLALISAPAGFGKTTLLSEWIYAVETADESIPTLFAWLSLDKGDNDPNRFWSYFVSALREVRADIGEATLAMLQSPQPPPVETLVADLINEVAAASPAPLVLVLDDLHLVTTAQIHNTLTFLVEHLPPQMHLVVSGRADPPWPLARLRARCDIAEVRADALRFTREEAFAFLNNVMKLGLAPEDVAALEERTEGWIAGLQMAALAMQSRLAAPGRPAAQERLSARDDLAGFVKAFTGSNRFVLDYLIEEVWERQSPAIQEFLLKTCLLERMSAPLCDAVTGRNDSQSILSQLDRSNLFLISLDDERRWYRYHHLFADLLRNRLEHAWPEQTPELYRRASQWYEHEELVSEAIHYATSAGDVGLVARLVEGNAMAMIDRGEMSTFLGWLGALPEAAVRARPWLCVAHAWVLAYTGQLDPIESLLQSAEQSVASDLSDAAHAAEKRHIQGHIAAIRGYHIGLVGNFTQAAVFARQALEQLPDGDLSARGFAAFILAVSTRRQGNLQAAAQALAETLSTSQAVGRSHVAMLIGCNLAGLQMEQGHLRKSEAMFRQLIANAESRPGHGGSALPAGLGYIRLADVLYEWNELDQALRYGQMGLEICRHWGQAEFIVTGHLSLAETWLAMGEPARAQEQMRQARVACSTIPWSRVRCFEAQLWLRQGNLAAASRWAQESGLRFDDPLTYESKRDYAALARVLVAQRQYSQALPLLERLLTLVEAAGANQDVIAFLALQALALYELGRPAQAIAALERALTLAEPENYIRTFVDAGASVGAGLPRPYLISDFRVTIEKRTRGEAKKLIEYADRLLTAFPRPASTASSQSAIRNPKSEIRNQKSELLEPLSDRERQVLQLLATGLANKEIAQRLVIAEGTVKQHLKSIYEKLAAHNRTQAAAQARKLGLL